MSESHPDDVGYYQFEVSPTGRYIILDPASNPMDAASVVALLNAEPDPNEHLICSVCGLDTCVYHTRFPKESK